MLGSVPKIPGQLIIDTAKISHLKETIATLLGLKSYKFPGAQPISFGAKQLDEIEQEDFYVAEKSDGVRCLALLTSNQYKEPEIYLFDRKNNFHLVRNFRFPIPNDPNYHKCLKNTIIDGEFVLDKEEDGSSLRINENEDLLQYLNNDIIKPHQGMLRKYPIMKDKQQFSVQFKEQQFAHHLDSIFKEVIPNLKHGSDGLIFTSVNAPYVMGTCNKMLKWKPLNENSIDFKVKLVFPGTNIQGVKDYSKKPRIDLLVWQGGKDYTYFNELGVTDDEWKEKFGDSPRYMDGKIIECNYEPELQQQLNLKSPWRFMRYRDDKEDGNHQKTVDNVLQSIRDAVTKEELIERIPRIKEAADRRKRNNEHNSNLDDRQTKKRRQE
ncbi:mRNA capping enzyme, catalytic domain-containing protein [Mycotypha africana]|uniref:mRNA capping enzyme, catalytic domain-containing protein n=1 Tax=Mycotypha africana TaxID=64632 RepID=UPI002301B27E|nr:mRNA capping enzyme, catalytic domain-containing protein [Mycotypha africana]KAI8971930.1 mRNA capping enzyme, catalytic domain-containing protein [Mycotypha africana]